MAPSTPMKGARLYPSLTVIDVSAETWYVFMAATVMTTLCVLAGPV